MKRRAGVVGNQGALLAAARGRGCTGRLHLLGGCTRRLGAAAAYRYLWGAGPGESVKNTLGGKESGHDALRDPAHQDRKESTHRRAHVADRAMSRRGGGVPAAPTAEAVSKRQRPALADEAPAFTS